jgi:hypothetical protein
MRPAGELLPFQQSGKVLRQAKLLTRDEARRIARTSPSCRSWCALDNSNPNLVASRQDWAAAMPLVL